jgi:sodium transport system permease protein
MSPTLIVAHKEIRDHLRDQRSLVSAMLFAAMGPLAGTLVLASGNGTVRDGPSELVAMMSVFALVSVFVGGMGVALDVVAGERERRSLVPLMMNPVRPIDLLAGKWLAVSAFGAVGLAVNLCGCAALWITANESFAPSAGLDRVALPLAGLVCLVPLAAALELLVSTACRSVKEAQPYTSILVFLAMGAGMLVEFLPQMAGRWWFLMPFAGQQFMIGLTRRGETVALMPALSLCTITIGLSFAALVAAAELLGRDEIAFGS